jgi:hypothetical protein
MLELGPDLFQLLNERQWVGNQQPIVYGRGGLSAAEIAHIERALGFALPPDFSYLLQNVVDEGGVLFPWKNFEKQAYDESIAMVLQGIEFDIEHANLWLWRWKDQPHDLAEAIAIMRRDFASWPKLLPVYGHRYLAADPCLPDNPVFSIWQTDIIHYGANLAHYLVNEFVGHDGDHHTYDQSPRRIPIWTDFTEFKDDFRAWPDGIEAAASAPWHPKH